MSTNKEPFAFIQEWNDAGAPDILDKAYAQQHLKARIAPVGSGLDRLLILGLQKSRKQSL